MRNQLEGVDAAGRVLGGGGDPIAGMQGGVWGASGSFLHSLQSLEGTVVTVIWRHLSSTSKRSRMRGSASAMSCRCPASSCTTSTSASQSQRASDSPLVVARALMNAGGFGPCGLIFVDGGCPLLGQGAGLVAVAEGRQCADRHGRAFCCQVVHDQFRRWADDGDPVVGADGGDARIAEYFTCRGVDVVTGNTLPRAMSALSYQLVTVTNCAAAVALCVATARDGCRSTNLRRPNNGRERNRSFHSRPAQRRSMLRWRMLATNVAQPISRPSDGSTTPLRAGEEQSGAAVSGTPACFTPCRPTRHQPGRQRRVA